MAQTEADVLVEVVVDSFEPPMPARVSAGQALHFAEAPAKGQRFSGKIALTIFRDKLDELF
jgi:pyruvate dehydrogenase (quinone)